MSLRFRNHIHFAPGLPNDSGVISGMRQICNIVIFIDLEAALQGGFRSPNTQAECIVIKWQTYNLLAFGLCDLEWHTDP